MCTGSPKHWHKWLALAKWWYNTNFHTATTCTPFEILYGYKLSQLALGPYIQTSVQGADDLIFFSTTIATRIESYTLSSSITHEILNGSRMLRSPIPSWGLGLPQAETIQVNQFTISSPLEAKFQVCRPVSSASMCGINGLQA